MFVKTLPKCVKFFIASGLELISLEIKNKINEKKNFFSKKRRVPEPNSCTSLKKYYIFS